MRRAILLLTTVAGMVLLVMALGIIPNQQRPAQAQTDDEAVTGPTLQFGCGVAKTEAIDPILDPEHPHDHVFYGNKGVSADSTYESLVANKDTTCSLDFATSSYWNPVVKDGETEVNPPKRLSIYYTGKSDQTKVQPLPDGLQLLANKDNGRVDYRCGTDKPVTSPPYGCTASEYRIRVHFPECWNQSSLGPKSLVRMKDGACPSTHPYQIPSIRMAVHYENVGGVLEGPLQVSAGNGEYLGADFFHADVFSAPQEPAFRDTIKKCVNNVADGATPPAVCRPGLRPDTTLAPSGPSGTVASGSGTFTFSSAEPDATFKCRVYEAGTTPGSFGACSGNGTHEVSGLADGKYTFEVRAHEPFSYQEDLSPASRTWTVDSTAPADTTAPTVDSTTPSNGATGVKRSTSVTATFSEAMDPATLTTDLTTTPAFTLVDPAGNKVSATVTLSSDGTTATLKPASALAASKQYTAKVTKEAKDKAGNPLASDKIWSFTTGKR